MKIIFILAFAAFSPGKLMGTCRSKSFESLALNLNGCGSEDIMLMPRKSGIRLNVTIKIGSACTSARMSAGVWLRHTLCSAAIEGIQAIKFGSFIAFREP